MEGRFVFNKYRHVLYLFARIMQVFPRRLRIKFLNSQVFGQSRFGVAWRYILLLKLAKSCGDNVSIRNNVYLGNVQNLEIGSNVSIHQMCYLECSGGIIIGDNVSIAHGSSILSVNHSWADEGVPIKYNPIEKKTVTIESDVWVGCGSRILAGVTIYNRSIIAAGAVVTKDVPTKTIVGGVPARVLKPI